MRRFLRARARCLARDQRGFTLIEMLVGATLMIIVMSACLALIEVGQGTASRDSARTLAIREAQTGLTNMVRDLRQATEIVTTATTANKVRLRMPTATSSAATAFQDSFVEYDCGTTSGGDCLRYQWLVSAGATRPSGGVTVVKNVLNAGTAVTARQIFTVDANSGVGTVRLEVPAAGDRACPTPTNCREFESSVVLDDGFLARNLQDP